jgi:hypothetical protein
MKLYRFIVLIILPFLYLPDNLLLSHHNQTVSVGGKGAKQEEILNNYVYKENLKSVKIFPEGWEIGYPVIDIRKPNRLVFSFDDLTTETKNYSYTLIHCDSDWKRSEILQTNYLQGFTEANINDYEYSRNTFRDFIHYTLYIPSEDLRPTLPGNYILMVYEDYDRSKLVISSRFYIVDYLVNIEGTAKRTENMLHFNTSQEVDFTIKYKNLHVDDPDENIRVCISQNNSYLNTISGLRPSYVQNNVLTYDYEEENRFPGLNEFRYFSTKNLKYITDPIKRVDFQRPYEHVYLLPDPVRTLEKYDFYEDMNGASFITREEGYDSGIDADYMMMHFSLPFDAPMPGADIYVYGGISNWALQPELKMEFNLESRSYELVSPVKQGLYNYQYVVVSKDVPPDFTLFEGNHFETENDYLIFVYHKDFSKRYESLVGFKVLNSIDKRGH